MVRLKRTNFYFLQSGMPKTSKLFQFINYRMRVTLQDGRQFVGKFMAFDKHMNLIICDCEEFRKIVPKGSKKGLSKEECNFFAGEEKEEKRTLGLVILRGETIISMTVEGPPPAEESRIKTLQKEGIQLPGIAKSASRGMVIPTTNANAPVPGLNAPIPNLGGPSHAAMVPQMGRGMMPPMGGIPPPPFARGMPFPYVQFVPLINFLLDPHHHLECPSLLAWEYRMCFFLIFFYILLDLYHPALEECPHHQSMQHI